MRTAVFLAAAMFAAMPARADDLTDLMEATEQFRSAYNAADLNAWTSLCAKDAVIMDSVPPFVFRGPNACSTWWQAQIAANKKNGWIDTKFLVDKPVDFGVEGDNAFLTVMAQFSYTLNDKTTTFPGLWMLSFHHTKAGWQVVAWTWAG